MKRYLVGAGLAATLVLGAPTAAHAHEQHHRPASTHHCAIAPRCRPAPLPTPPGGWPCAKDHSCSTKHHRPICKPKPKPKPPVHVTPKPPVKVPQPHLEGHKQPPRVTLTAASPTLPRTGADVHDALAVAGGLLFLGGLSYAAGRVPRQQSRAMRAGIAATRTRRRARRERVS